MRKLLRVAVVLSVAVVAAAQPPQPAPAKRAPASPPAETSIDVNGKKIVIKYSAPSVKGRQMLGEGGRISQDRTWPVWRLGANSATALHTDADLDIGGLAVPAGDYTLFALVNEQPWQLIVNKQTGQWGLAYQQAQDLGRTKMTMSKPASLVETLKITLSSEGGNKARLTVEFENVVAGVPITVK
jgi:hypothetical protein